MFWQPVMLQDIWIESFISYINFLNRYFQRKKKLFEVRENIWWVQGQIKGDNSVSVLFKLFPLVPYSVRQ